jgi:hypothetical protein
VLGNEVIQFANVEVISPGVYRLSNLLRGRLGTEGYIASHVMEERFVLLDDAVIAKTVPVSNKGVTWNLRATTYGNSMGFGTSLTHVIQGNSLKPYRPVHLVARRSGTGDVTVHWKRRARIDGGLRDYVDIPLKEAMEQYEVKMFDGATEKRSWRVSTSQVVYTAAEQTADFGTAPTSLTLTIAQLSALIGLGHLAQQTVVIE